MRSAVFVLLWLTSLALFGCSSPLARIYQPPEQTILATERVELPTVFLKGMPYVELKINGKGPYRFLVDTGASCMAISPRVAREADVGFTPAKVRLEASSGAFVDLTTADIDRLEAPGFTLKGFQSAVLTLETTQQLGTEEDYVGGIIGMGTLRHVLLEIDYPHHKVSVARLDSATPPLESGHPFSGTGPYAVVRPRVMFATPSAKHPLINVMIDTGSAFGFDISDITAFPLLVGLSKGDDFRNSLGGPYRSFVGQLNGDIRLGQATWRNPKIFSADQSRIGSEALAPWKLVIDPKRSFFWLVGDKAVSTTTWTGPRDPDGRPSVYGFAALPEGDSLIVKEVDPGSRAEYAGLKVGDRYTFESADSDMPGERAGKDPSRMLLRIIRGEEKLEIIMSLLDPLPAKTTSEAGTTVAE